MATKTGSVSQRKDWYKYYLTYSESNVSIANNTSQVTVAVYVESTYPYSGTASTGSGTYKTTLKINGTSYTASKTGMTFKKGTKFKLIEKTVTITHSSDGSKSIKISASSTLNDSSGYGPKSGNVPEFTFTLTKIARASSFGSSTPSSCNAGSSFTVYLSVKNSGFSHKVALTCGSKTKTISIAAGKTSASFAVDADFGKQMTTSTSKAGTLKLTTYNGSSQVGSAVSKSFTVKIPSSVTPSISLVACNGKNLVSNKYIQNHSSVEIQVKQSTSYSSYGGTVTTYILVNDSNKKSFTGTTTGSVTVPITSNGSLKIQAYSIDSRKRRTPASGYTTLKTISVEAYTAPKLSNVNIYRVNANGAMDEIEGEYAYVSYTVTISSCGGVNSIAKNSVVLNDKSFSLTSSGNNFQTQHNTSYVFSTDLSYSGKISITDTVGKTVIYNLTLSSAKVLIDFHHNGKGIAFGKVAEMDGMDVALPMYFRNGIYLPTHNNSDFVKNTPLNLGTAEEIPNGADLNSYTAPGTYDCKVNATAETIVNRPSGLKNLFKLVVQDNGGTNLTGTQMLYSLDKIYFRYFWRSNANWLFDEWVQIHTDGGSNFYTAKDQFFSSGNYGFNFNNSDVIGFNGIYFNDAANDGLEGLNFPKSGISISGPDYVFKETDFYTLRIDANGELKKDGNLVPVYGEHIGKTLWSGSWKSGSITIPNLKKYRLFALFDSEKGTVILVPRTTSWFRGLGGYISDSENLWWYAINAEITNLENGTVKLIKQGGFMNKGTGGMQSWTTTSIVGIV